MPARGVNHVSVSAPDLERSVAFYSDLFGAEVIPSPNFGIPVVWLRLGGQQLHLFQRGEAPPFHHFGVTVDDVVPVYERATELGVLDDETFGHHLFELPGDTTQLYLRDPAGNLVEVDAPAASALPEQVRRHMRRLADVRPQSPENEGARLYVEA